MSRHAVWPRVPCALVLRRAQDERRRVRSERSMPPLSAATISPASRLRGRLRVPGDKSIAHRYALFAAMAEGSSTLAHFAPAADCRSTLTALRDLGVEIEAGPAGTAHAVGRRFGRLR